MVITLHLKKQKWVAEVEGKQVPLTANGVSLTLDNAPVDILGEEITRRYPAAQIFLGREISNNPFYQAHLDLAASFNDAPILRDVQKILDHPETKECYRCQSDAYFNGDRYECVKCGAKEIINSKRHFNYRGVL